MKRKIVSVLGTRPEIVKFSPLLPLLDRTGNHHLIHTGQHYDPRLDAQFFHDLELTQPWKNLNIGSHPAPIQIAKMLAALGEEFLALQPDLVFVLGDTNSTLAGALAAVKCGAKVVHIESGCRSFRKDSPEEQNRIVVDHLSSIHFAPDALAKKHLQSEGISNVYVTGSVGLEALQRAKELRGSAGTANPTAETFALATIHRAENTSNQNILAKKLKMLAIAAKEMPVYFPIHPRTQNLLALWNLALPKGVIPLPPLSYLEFLAYLEGASCVLTDSGGIQEEAALLGVPCIVLRTETEWLSYVREKRNFLVGDSTAKLNQALKGLAGAKRIAVRKPIRAPKAAAMMMKTLKQKGLL
jgi:UDP-N-acetylglucosamine 2-epimerase